MGEEGGDHPDAHLLAAGGAEPAGLEEGGGGDEGRVVPVPESGGVGDEVVAPGEELLEVRALKKSVMVRLQQSLLPLHSHPLSHASSPTS